MFLPRFFYKVSKGGITAGWFVAGREPATVPHGWAVSRLQWWDLFLLCIGWFQVFLTFHINGFILCGPAHKQQTLWTYYTLMNFGQNVWTVWILKLGTNQSMLTHNGTHVSHMLGRIFFLTSGCWRHVASSRSQSPKNPCCQWASVRMLLNPLGWDDSYLLCLRLRSSQIMFSGNQWLALGSPIKGNPRGDHVNPWRYGVHHQHRICQLLAGAVGA